MAKLLLIALIVLNACLVKSRMLVSPFDTHSVIFTNMMKSKVAQITYWGMSKGNLAKNFETGVIRPGKSVTAIVMKDTDTN